jgi:hypothetical protein
VPGPCTPYKSKAQNRTYLLNTLPADAGTAEAACIAQGGHLVTYTSQAEQYEVEQYFAATAGCLLPAYHRAYWTGLQKDSPSSPYAWLDHAPYGSEESYSHW